MGSNPASSYETQHKFMQVMVISESQLNQATASFLTQALDNALH